jgi:hypothetical protein
MAVGLEAHRPDLVALSEPTGSTSPDTRTRQPNGMRAVAP